MLMLLTIFASSFVIALSGAMMPGTLLTVTISESSRRGVLAGPLLIVGHSVLELALLIALLFGFAPLFTQERFLVTVSLLGGSILLWMAIGMFRALPSLKIAWDAQDSKRGNLILTGILMSMINPYWLLWWATIGIGLVLQARQVGMWGVVCFFLGHILADFAWYALISTAVGKGRAFFTDRVYRGVIGVCATALTVFACMFIYKAIMTIVETVAT